MATAEPILKPASPRQFDVFYDYLCPFVYRASVLLQNVRDSGERPIEVRWRYFSLIQVNSKDEGWTFNTFHMALLRARHEQRADINDVAVVERVAEDSGLDLDRFRKDIADPKIVSALERDHRAAVAEYGVFGTPTFVFDAGAAYVRLSEPPEASDSVAIYDRVISIAAEEPRILEIKRPVKPSPD